MVILFSSGGAIGLPIDIFHPGGLVDTDGGAGGGVQFGLLAGAGGIGRCGRDMADFNMMGV